MSKEIRFNVGQLIKHQLFGYRGVIYDVDPRFCGSDEWYEQATRTRPPKDEPWYHVLVDGAEHTTYVAQRNLKPDSSSEAISHPLLEQLFEDLRDGAYLPRGGLN